MSAGREEKKKKKKLAACRVEIPSEHDEISDIVVEQHEQVQNLAKCELHKRNV